MYFSEEVFNKHYEDKVNGLEAIFGPMEKMVGHAIIPFEVGGSVDMYYFSNHVPGTALVTMELIAPDGKGSKPNSYGTYEFVSFTKHPYVADSSAESAFSKIERRICGNFTTLGFYSRDATLKPGDTCEIPRRSKPNGFVLLDKYPASKPLMIGSSKHHLLLCIEVFESEMEFGRNHGSDQLLQKLKAANIFPYSDLDRKPIV